MTSAWPQLDELIRELSEVSSLPSADREPSLTDATIAVTKATTALSHAARTRGRSAEAALSQALTTVEEARALLRQARLAISVSVARQRRVRASAMPEADVAVPDRAEATCSSCECAFVVRYRAVAGAPVVAFPVACPAAECDGVSEVEYPGSAVDVTVELLPGR